MTRKCELSGVVSQYGNNVSHSQRKTRRPFKVNVRKVTLRSNVTGKDYTLKVAMKTLRTIEKLGGIDGYVKKFRAENMSDKAQSIRLEVLKKEKQVAA